MRKIVITEQLKPGQLLQIEELLPQWEVICCENECADIDLLRSAEIITGFVGGEQTKSVLAGSNKLRWLHVWSAGVDSLPLDKLAEQDVILTNSSGVHTYSITEVIFMFLLGLSRRLQYSLRSQIRQEWNMVKPLAGLFGKTIGILGIGAIGSQTAAVAHAYGMKVLGLNRSGAVSSNVDKMYKTEQLHELLPQCDYVVNILPLTTETRHILAKTQFELMKDDAIYVNVGRGGTNDTSALISALKNGKLAAAGLDVFENEPLPSDDPLWQMEQVMITAHNAGMTRDYVDRVMDILTANIADYLQTGIPGHNLVDLDREY